MHRKPSSARFPSSPIRIAAGLMAFGVGLAAAQEPTQAELAQQLREQQQQLERQRQELDRQREALDRQQRQLESLAASLEARMQAEGQAPASGAASTAAAAPSGAGVPDSAGVATAGTAGGAAAAAGQAGAGSVGPGPGGRGLRFAGYAEMNYQRYDFYENAQAANPDKRGRTDVARFVLSPQMDLGRGWSWAGEIEFEHGGTGSTIEYEAEEAGEFEAEIEKGGEIVLEQLWLQYAHSPALRFRVGELVVPFGMVNLYHQPTEYFTIERSQSELSMIPSVWHETGVQLLGDIGAWRYQLQFVTALDSTGFSGYEFVRGGMQRKLEYRNASAFAVVMQGEYAFAPGITAGGAVYTGDSAPNRPRQNLEGSARVTLAELHGRYQVGPLTVRGQALFGRLQNAAAVTRANLNTYNGSELGTSRTPVGSRARSWFVEAGYDLFSIGGPRDWGRLDLFARYEDYDTHAGTEGGIVRSPRYARRAATLGLNYKPMPGLVFKAEASRRRHDGPIGDTQNLYGLAAGFEF